MDIFLFISTFLINTFQNLKINSLSLSEMIVSGILWFFITSSISICVNVFADIFFLIDISSIYLINLSMTVIMILHIIFTEVWIDKNNSVTKFLIIICQNYLDVSIAIELFSLVLLDFLIIMQVVHFFNTFVTFSLMTFTFCIIFS